ncbi:MAG: DNA (cytosine-5-)-methyltransferase [Clostridia bacterium]
MTINTFFDFCSGIGGGRLGLEKAGLKCVGRSETSRLADTTYRLMHNTENELNYGNLKRITADRIPAFDLLIAGFPCQTFSVIGRQEGFSDDRGQIIFQLSRILKEAQPMCFILENVKGLVTHDGGKTIKTILEELNSVGYDTSYRVLTSLNYGVPQMRQRVYFIGFKKSLKLDYSKFEWPKEIEPPLLSDFLIDNHTADDSRLNILNYYLKNPVNMGKYTIDDIKSMEGRIIDTRMNDLRIYKDKCPTLRAQRDGVLYVRDGIIHQLTGYEALLLQGFPKEYADKVKNKVTDRHLLMQAGNAMTVTVIKALGKSIIDFLKITGGNQ